MIGDLDGARTEQGKSQPMPRSLLSHSEWFHWGRRQLHLPRPTRLH